MGDLHGNRIINAVNIILYLLTVFSISKTAYVNVPVLQQNPCVVALLNVWKKKPSCYYQNLF